MEVLTADVRERAPWPTRPRSPTNADSEEPATSEPETDGPKPATDIQAALAVISRRELGKDTRHLDLSNTDLQDVKLAEAKLRRSSCEEQTSRASISSMNPLPRSMSTSSDPWRTRLLTTRSTGRTASPQTMPSASAPRATRRSPRMRSGRDGDRQAHRLGAPTSMLTKDSGRRDRSVTVLARRSRAIQRKGPVCRADPAGEIPTRTGDTTISVELWASQDRAGEVVVSADEHRLVLVRSTVGVAPHECTDARR